MPPSVSPFPAKAYYRIGEAAHMLGVTPSTLRFWESAFRLRLSRGSQGHRRYSAEDMDRLRSIQQLMGEYKLAVAQKVWQHRHAKSRQKHRLLGGLKALRELLAQLRKSLGD